MEMVLHTVKVGLGDVLIEKGNSLSGEPRLLFVLWKIVVIQLEIEAVSGLVELHRLVGLDHNVLIIEVENVILEIFVDWKVGLEINWRLGESEFSDKLWAVISFQLLMSKTLQEGNTWSFWSWVREVFGIIILEFVLMLVLAVWGAEKWSSYNSLLFRLFNLVLNLSLFTEILLVGHIFWSWNNVFGSWFVIALLFLWWSVEFLWSLHWNVFGTSLKCFKSG